jgi:lipase (class 3)
MAADAPLLANDREIAAAVLASYSAGFAWRRFWTVAEVRAGLAEIPGSSPGTGERVLIYVGTEDLADLERDLMAWGTRSAAHPQLGFVEAGFLAGLEESLAAMMPELPEGCRIAGHSLGAARAQIAAGLLMLGGRAPRALVLWGSPRPGGADLARLIRDIPATSYRNRVAGPGPGSDQLDPVTTLPPDLGPLILPYLHPYPFTDIAAPPDPGDSGPLRMHAMALYAMATPDHLTGPRSS